MNTNDEAVVLSDSGYDAAFGRIVGAVSMSVGSSMDERTGSANFAEAAVYESVSGNILLDNVASSFADLLVSQGFDVQDVADAMVEAGNKLADGDERPYYD